MKCKFFTFLFSISTLFSTAQNAKLEGKITDEKGEGLIQANVIIDAAKGLATVTDFDGNYELSVPAGTYEVIYRYVGKEEQRLKLTFKEGDKLTQNMKLKEREKLMDQVVITGSKYEKKLSEETVSMEVMKNTVLQNQNITDVQSGVQKIPGVTIADGQANIRGGSGWSYGAGSRVAVLYDDMTVTTADADDAKWSMIPVENIEQIEVLKGSASAIYGTGALNGVINARMAYPTDQPFTKIQTYAGFYDKPSTPEMQWWKGKPQYFVGANFADRRKVGQWDIITGLSYNNDRGWLDSSDNQDARVNAKIRYRFKKLDGLTVGVNALAYWSWGKTFFLWDSIGYKGYKPLTGTITVSQNGRYLIDPFINYFDKKGNKFAFKYRWLNSSNINSTGQGSIAHRHILDLSYQRPFDVSSKVKLNFVAGVGGRIDRIAPPGATDTSYLYGKLPAFSTNYDSLKHKANNASIYAQVDGKFFNRLNVTLGARWEYFNVDGRNSLKELTYPLFRIGLNYQAAEATYIRGSFGQGFRYPSVAELYVTTSLSLLTIYPNIKLKPEKGYSAEIGVKQGFQFGKSAKTRGYVDVAGFWNQYQNMMEFMFGVFGKVTDPGLGAGFTSQNIGDARILGGDFVVGAETSVKDFKFNILVGYTYINTKALNWDKPITIFNAAGDTLTPSSNGGTFVSAYNSANAPKGFDTANKITYGMTSSSNTNQLKYRPTHQLKVIFNAAFKKFDVNLDYQFISYQKNIDKAFVSDIFGALSPAFRALKQYRDAQEAKNYAGDHILNIGVGYKPVDKFKISFICKNVLNWEWMPRPGRLEAPRSYTLQLAYTF